MKKLAVISVAVGLVVFAAIFGGATVLLNTAPGLYPEAQDGAR
jgi:hypothetical protein